ncbi:MAG: hypothetical protein ABSE73_09245, partial [Planctomycetota bacterium]
VDLGVVHLAVRRGRFMFNFPRPSSFGPLDRLKSTLVEGNPGAKARYSNLKLGGTAVAQQGPPPWQFSFLVEFQSKSTHLIQRVRYRYTVVNP